MGTNADCATDRTERSDRASDDCTATPRRADPDEGARRDIEAACRSFEADERAAAERERAATREPADNDWNAVGLVTSLGATCLFGVGGLLARSTHLTTAASVAFVTVGVLLARRGRRRLG